MNAEMCSISCHPLREFVFLFYFFQRYRYIEAILKENVKKSNRKCRLGNADHPRIDQHKSIIGSSFLNFFSLHFYLNHNYRSQLTTLVRLTAPGLRAAARKCPRHASKDYELAPSTYPTDFNSYCSDVHFDHR